MLPEFWTQTTLDEPDSKPAAARRRRQVTEIFTWLQCFCTYVSVLASKHPESMPELMAYIITITRVSQDFAGMAWVRYDAAFRRQAAITGNRRWSQINPSLYSICFTGRAQQTNRCELCFNSSHQTKECALMAEPDPELPSRLKAVETAVVSLATRRSPESKPATIELLAISGMPIAAASLVVVSGTHAVDVESHTHLSRVLVGMARERIHQSLLCVKTPLVCTTKLA